MTGYRPTDPERWLEGIPYAALQSNGDHYLCPQCGGYGSVPSSDTCPTCKGTCQVALDDKRVTSKKPEPTTTKEHST